MALVIVLGMLVLITVLAVAFLSSVSSELQNARSYSNELGARTLADSAVNIVISQIQDATTTPTLAWASQPGMIRTYDDGGNAVGAYKLYSSSDLHVTGGFNALTSVSTEVPVNWSDPSKANVYTDLNKPVVANNVTHYPIIDPGAVAALKSGGPSLAGSVPPIEGCFLDTANAATAVTTAQTNPVPMPVQWMYVLKDGSIAAIDPVTGKVNGAGKKMTDGTLNAITGRIAFWTDDESCKVNVNTASEGTFWDRPWTESKDPSTPTAMDGGYENQLAMSMPVQNEFQRYPGHPAMTCLSPIFPPLPQETTVAYNKRLFGIIPRIVGGGSESGTGLVTAGASPLVPDSDRLFASVDEFLFSVSGSPRQLNSKGPSSSFTQDDIERTRFFLTTSSRAPEVNLFNKPRITLWPLQFNTNVNTNERNAKDKLIAFCSTIGSGSAAKPYYFQRLNTPVTGNVSSASSQSPIDDWTFVPRNQELYAYLQTLTGKSIPGLGGSFLIKYSGARDQILTEMMDYCRSQVNTFNTGTGSGAADKAGWYFYAPFDPAGFIATQSQIVPLSLPDGTTPPKGVALPNGAKGFGRFPTVTQAALVLYRKDKLIVSGPSVGGGSKKLPDDSPIALSGTNFTTSDFVAPINVGAVLILHPFNPTPGPPPWSGNVRYVVTGLDKFKADSNSMGFQSPLVNLVNALDSMINATALTGFETNFQYFKSAASPRFPKTLGPTVVSSPDPQYYPFFGDFVLQGSTFVFSGGAIKIDIYQGTSGPLDPKDLVQTINMTFPPATLPTPTYSRTQTASTITDRQTDSHGYHYTDYNQRLSHKNADPAASSARWGVAEDLGHNPLPFIVGSGNYGDTVRSVEARYGGPAAGDYRMIAGLRNVPDTFFEGHGLSDPPKDGKKYSDSVLTSRLMHSLHIWYPGNGDTSNQVGYYLGAGAAGDPRGKLVSGVTYPDDSRGYSSRNSRVPIVPRGLDGAYMDAAKTLPGDWDTGIGGHPDGPFINKADEGNASGVGSKIGYSLYYDSGGYANGAATKESGAAFAPNRQISSAVAFGSLPTGVDPTNPANVKPWQTLLFCKHPAAGSRHPGFATPPDHAFLDLFTMPIVEPYAISEPFSTAGRVNMNYQIVPFTYLTRDTSVRAVLKSTNIMAIPTASGPYYKQLNATLTKDYRYTIDPDEQQGTLQGFEKRFGAGDIFHSASEICDISLVPKNPIGTAESPGSPTYATMATWWNNYQLTGDNVREQPYGHLYPRLTTKSNTFTVHVKTQSLKKAINTPVDQFVEGRDLVTSEFRGSFTVQRYLDPNSDSLVLADGKTAGTELDPNAMVGPYKFRIINSKHFAP